MNAPRISRAALSLVSAVLLAGCGGSQPPVTPPGAMFQRPVAATNTGHIGSWMLPEAKKRALLYVGSLYDVYVYSYPAGSLVGTLTGFYDTSGLCSDKNGNVWITDSDDSRGQGYVVEYAHGGTSPVRTLSEPYESPEGCSVDPQSGDLAVANGNSLLIYPNASGTPTEYQSHYSYGPFITCTYDNAGNVYIATNQGFYDAATLWLPKGGSSLSYFPIYPKPFPHPHIGIQWDGKYLVTEANSSKILQNVIEGSQAQRHARIEIVGRPEYLWIQGSRMIGTYYNGTVVYWKYPEGGQAIRQFSAPASPLGVTVSVPSR